MADLESCIKTYWRTRGLRLKSAEYPNGKKLEEETDELVEALEDHEKDRTDASYLHVQHEIADVALVLARYAKQVGTTIEECIALKTAKDRGRDKRG